MHQFLSSCQSPSTKQGKDAEIRVLWNWYRLDDMDLYHEDLSV